MRDVVKIATFLSIEGCLRDCGRKRRQHSGESRRTENIWLQVEDENERKGAPGGAAMLGHSVRSNCQNTNALEHGAHTDAHSLSFTHTHTLAVTQRYTYTYTYRAELYMRKQTNKHRNWKERRQVRRAAGHTSRWTFVDCHILSSVQCNQLDDLHVSGNPPKLRSPVSGPRYIRRGGKRESYILRLA